MKIVILLCSVMCSLNTFASFSIEKTNAFSLKTKSPELINFKNPQRSTVVIFLSKDCPCSKGNLDYINQLSVEFKDFRFIGIHSKRNSTPEEVISYLQDKKLNFEIYNDIDLKNADLFKALKTPHAFIVNTEGVVVYNGGITNTTFPKNAKEFFLKNALVDIENQKQPALAETRTLGCFILR